MKYSILLLISLFFTIKVRGFSYNFDFYLGRYLIGKDEEITVHLKYDLQNFKEDSFLVRPVIENGIVEIYNVGNNFWVTSYSILPSLPILNEEMTIKIRGLEVEKTGLYFQIFNMSTGEIYTTPKKTVWSKKIYSKYLEKVNEKIFGNVVSKEDAEFSDVNYLESAQITPSPRGSPLDNIIDKFSKEFFYLVPLFVFIVSFFIGFKYKSKETGMGNLDIKNRTYGVNGKIH